MKKLIAVLILFSCTQQTNQEKYKELFQMETNLSASYHDLSKMIHKIDSASQPEAYQATLDNLKNLKKTLDSVRAAMRELPGIDSAEANKYSR